MLAEDRPAWLPDGWKMEVKTRRSGSKDRYYTCPLSGWTFRSKPEVMRHLSTGKVDASELVSHVEDNKQQLAAPVDNSLEWLPSGWILETKMRMSGVSIGTKYKCYFDPFTGSRFYSKREVFRHLKAHKLCSSTSARRSCINNNSANYVRSPTDRKRSISANLTDNDCASNNDKKCIKTNSNNVKAVTKYSPNELPHGWIKEVRIRKNNTQIKKDPYYIDPVSGYVFRSKRDVFRYVETGEVSKRAFRQNERRTAEVYSLKKESTPPIAARRLRSATKRCLFPQPQSLNTRMPIEIADFPQRPSSPPLRHASAQSGVEGSETSYLTQVNMEHLEKGNAEFQIECRSIPAFLAEGIPGDLVELGREQVSEPAIKELPEPVSENPSKPLVQLEDEKLLVPDGKLFEEGLPDLTKKQRSQPKKRRRGRLPRSSTTRATKAVGSGLGSRKITSLKAITMPLRASKRLAGVKAAPVTDFGIGDRSLREKAKRSDQPQANPAKNSTPRFGSLSDQQKATVLIDLGPPENPESKEPSVEQAAQGEQVNPLTLPFGDFWPDPCIEFAFKTLIGDFPVLEDTKAIQDYFNQQHVSTQSRSPSGTFGVPESAQLEPQDDRCSPLVGGDGSLCSLENGKKVNKGCHQNTGLNH